ncbi:MAG: cytochrome b/b6 domain-containing protein [Nitrospinae bacterium]|nr:cytochrome b/b6 domain-containing protein [Nitrospinota bacterium]
MASIIPTPKIPKQVVRVRNATNRVLHWLVFFAVIDLLITGYYIGNPILAYGQGEAYQATIMADIRFYHFIGAMVLDICIMLRVYLAFFSLYHRDWHELMPTPGNLKGAFGIIKSYLTFRKPPFFRYVDPFDGMMFLVLQLLMALQLFTGFQIYVHGLAPDYWWARVIHFGTDWTLWAFGSAQHVRMVHHLVQWIVVSGIILHVYIQVIKTVIWEDGHISAIFGGYKYKNME